MKCQNPSRKTMINFMASNLKDLKEKPMTNKSENHLNLSKKTIVNFMVNNTKNQ